MKFEILCVANDRSYLTALEAKAIWAFQTLYPNGLNGTYGGDGVVVDATTRIKHQKSLRKAFNKKEHLIANRERQKKMWTPEMKQERAQKVRALWANPEYRTKILSARKKPEQLPLITHVGHYQNTRRSTKKMWNDPERRTALLAKRRAIIDKPETRARISQAQTRAMQDRELRLRIGLAMCAYRDCVFEKGDPPRLHKYDRGGKLQETIPLLPQKFTCPDALRHGWLGREFERALQRGWIKIVSGEVHAGRKNKSN